MGVRVAIAGTGYWGINHVRAFAAQKGANVVAICDPDEAARNRALAIAPNARVAASVDELCASPDVDALVLATPAVAHAQQTLSAIAAGKHVFVEKPLALGTSDSAQIVRAASASKSVVMVGHLMVYHPVMRKFEELIADGTIGDIYYVYATRVNLGRLRKDENALWSLGPHDLSMILHLFKSRPTRVLAQGACYLQPGVEDVVFIHLQFLDGKMAHVQLSWLDPRKERRMTLVGSRRMVEFDDMHPTEKLKIYDKGYDRPPTFSDFGQYLTIRQGDVRIPRVDMTEPLAIECREFITCIERGTAPLSDAIAGDAVVQVLAAAQESLTSGRAVSLQ